METIIVGSARAEGAGRFQGMLKVGSMPDGVPIELPVIIVRGAQAEIGFDDMAVNEDVAKVSVIGVGMRSHAGVAKTMFSALAERGVNIQVISTSEIKISVLIDAAYTELAVRALHSAYGLDRA